MKVLSLFSGAGGLDFGFIMAGHNIIWANDLYDDAVKTYKKNIDSHIVLGDICEITSEAMPECDIIIGGFPCQGFSVANTKRHADDKRNALYTQMVRVIAAKRPKFFLAENVKGLANLDKGAVLERIIFDFESQGYKVKYKVLNSADYGVPQTRQRIFIAGVRGDISWEYNFPAPTHDANGRGDLKKWVSVSEALKDIPDPDSENNLPNHSYSKYKLTISGYIGHRLLDPDKPAPTVTARGDDRGGVVVLPYIDGKRRMSCRELASVQSFPKDYWFSGSNSSVYRQIANAVPPLLAFAVAREFSNYSDEKC